MAQQVQVTLDMPDELKKLRLPKAVDNRLQSLLTRQDGGEKLSPQEREEAEGLVNLAEILSLLRMRAQRVAV